MSSVHLVPKDIRDLYDVHDWRNATAILQGVYPEAWQDVIKVLREFRLLQSEILAPGGGKSPVASSLDRAFYARGWREKRFETGINHG